MKTKMAITSKLLTVLSFTLFFITSYSHAHTASTNKAAWEVCENKVKSESCQYTGHHDDLYIGSCQVISKSMLCVRNQPIQKAEKKKAST